MNMPSPAFTPSPLTPEVLERLHGAGLRLTVATRAVLGVLAGAPQSSPSHFEVLAQLKARGVAINRVTLYRLLDRLAACGLLLRHPDPVERRWRFTWAGANQAPARTLEPLLATGPAATTATAAPEPPAPPETHSSRITAVPQTAVQPQFECDSCHQLLPLELEPSVAAPGAAPKTQTPAELEAQLHAQALAQNWSSALAALGHRAQRLDLTLHGTCADCSRPPSNP
ncbi:MAG: hypothetical protein Q7J33_06320 [Serpentinimonas sp.]|nr:MAG: hypothetical protein JM57_00875 [Comamonadaceae bacterium BICA1-1]MDO9611440.1 hypothetical protein [Serpentinimonas sp.]